jgi:hypothetical protein
MAEVALYNYALSENRVRAHALTGRPFTTGLLGPVPVSYWRLGEVAGPTAYDVGHGANHGTYAGTPGFNQPSGVLTDTSNGSVSLSPANGGYVTIPQSASLTFDSTKGWTIEMWVYARSYPAAGVAQPFFCNDYPGGDSSGHIPIVMGFDWEAANVGKVMVGFHHGSLGWTKVVSAIQLPLNRWVHVVGNFDVGSFLVYIDGIVQGQAGKGTNPMLWPTASARYIGRLWSPVQIFDGLIDEVVLYGYYLNSYMIRLQYLRGVSRYASEVMNDDPQLYWRLGAPDTAGKTTDYGGYGSYSNGTYYGNYVWGQPGLLAGDSNTSVLFDGSTSYVQGAANYYTLSGPGSMECWARLDAGYTGNPRMMAHGANMAWQMFIDGGSRQICVFNFNGGVRYTGFVMQYGVTYHIVATVSAVGAGNTIVYVDGRQVFSEPTTAVASSSGMGFCVGQSGNNADWWKGIIDEVALYTTQLSAERVQAHYEAGRVQSVSRYDGAAWQPMTARRWDGSQWVVVTPRRYENASWK